MLRIPLAGLVAIALAAPAIAQETRRPLPEARTPAEAQAQYNQGYNGPRSPEAQTGTPETRALNNAVAANTNGMGLTLSAEAQTQYDADVDAWRKAVVRAARQKSADEAWYANQSRAYADAMYAWRLQVAACQRGNVKQCRYPSPDPADFY